MKNIISLFTCLFITFLFTSCSSDSSEESNANPSAQLIGAWNLTEININPPQDVNEDGTASANVLDELNCLSSTLVLNDNFSWTLSGTDLNVQFITGGLYQLTCKPTSSAIGTWSFSNNIVTLSGVIDATLQLNGETTLINNQDMDLPGFKTVVYKKQ